MALVACSESPSRAEGEWSTKPRESPACRGTVAHATTVPACCHLPKLVDTVSWGSPDRRPPPHPSSTAARLLQHTVWRARRAGDSVGTENA